MSLKILCFGDSNTWGYVPGSWDAELKTCDRFGERLRWPSILHNLLMRSGIPCDITEDAVPGRTVDIEHKDNPELNGKASLVRKYLDHLSVFRLIIIVLGVNDLKSTYHKTGEEIAASLVDLVRLIKSASPTTDVILAFPPKITKEDGFGTDFDGASLKSDTLRESLLKIEESGLCNMVKLEYKLNGIDGVHFSIGDNERLADSLNTKIQLLLKSSPEVFDGKKTSTFSTELK